MDLTGYTTSKPQPQACSIYTVSGQYVAGDYIRKTFTSIPLNHYQIVIRFSVGYIGSWSQSDSMLLEVNGNTEKWEYNSCAYAQDLCSGSLIDCFKTK
jgi:hypothetical protein